MNLIFSIAVTNTGTETKLTPLAIPFGEEPHGLLLLGGFL